MAERKKLSDILRNPDRERLEQAWRTTKPAVDLKPLPAGTYHCVIAKGELFNALTGTPGYKLTFEVLDGEYAGRLIWLDFWLTDAALAFALRDLRKIGIESFDQLERPLPDGLVASVRVVLRQHDNGAEFNRVRRFDLVAMESQAPDPFAPESALAPADASDEAGFDWSTGTQREGGPTP